MSLYNFFPYVKALLQAGEWGANYSSERNFYYINWLFWFATQVSSYTSLLALILGFMYLRDKKHRFLSYSTIALFGLNTLSSAIYASSRGMIIDAGFMIIYLFIFLYPQLRKATKQFILLATTIVLIIVSGFIIDVTVSRFSSDFALDSIIWYFGHPPITFNNGIAIIKEYSWGKYTLGILLGDYNINQSAVGGSWGRDFYTFVGWLFIDWGPIGVVFWGSIIFFFMRKIINKNNYKISDLILIFYYLGFLTQGVFVIGPQQIISILMMIVLFIIIKIFFENGHFVLFSHPKDNEPLRFNRK